MVWLNPSNVVTGFGVISDSILNSSVVHPREVFRRAIVATCDNIVLTQSSIW
ncbi:MAG: JAB domain-containing protein [Ignavibacteriaceae bacterium]